MKKIACAAAGLILCCMLGSCGTDGGEPPKSESSEEQSGLDERLEAIIQNLQQELLNLKASQKEQDGIHQQRIEELENLLKELQTKPQEPLPEETGPQEQTEEKPGSGEEGGKPELQDENYLFCETEGGVIITSYLKNESYVEIPKTLGGKPVVAIGEGAFRQAAVEQVVLPEGLCKIGWFAFSGCYRLTSLIVPDSVTEIEYGAFDGCGRTLRFTCSEGSYAADYAQSYGIGVIAKPN